ncbi:MAG TPA: Re/Si-specific NAD(P)(+) transhydrogenase subunit alpha [Aestuariivirgaceae bacterium]|jgi:proton-translocating NAD(P)+ transhydrogenase subunit alpha|nr:Re/Si-specific NAD(P)(+) transhydrogenase subunit alpha [Aestuariivirgaceae bacterium]
MKIAVPAEQAPGEARVAVSPETIKAYVRKGVDVAVETGAGRGSFIPDAQLAAAGATIAPSAEAALRDADIVLTVRRPAAATLAALRKGAVVAGQMDPFADHGAMKTLAATGASIFAMELMPRITRAQSMDVLSSQANLAGYKAVVDAAAHFSRAFPMMMTAAGTVPAARVFVMGAGVAGLQAIATARRLGAVVSATDVRAAAGEQVQSLGAKFIFVEGLADASTAAGYARELSPEDRERQAALVAEHIKGQDVVITTALIPGRPAPVLVTKEMVETMKPGSIIVDLAVERGGNCPLSRAGDVVVHDGVTIIGLANAASSLAGNASALYARNLQNFLDLVIKDGGVNIDWNDEIIAGCAIARDGEIVHPILKSAA